MSLVSAKEIAKVLNISKFGLFGNAIGWIILNALGLSKLNSVYDKTKHLKKEAFLNKLIDEFQIKFEIPDEDLKRIPKTGPFITVSNHPLGGIDGILLLKLLGTERPDFKILGNFILLKIEPLKDFVLPVNPFENRKAASSSFTGLKQALKHVNEGNALGVFPAGEVSTYDADMIIQDKPWELPALKFIKQAQVPVLPIYFHAKNSFLFYLLAKLSDTLRTAKLPSELLTQKNRTIKVRIGRPIPVDEQNEQSDLSKFSDFLRMKTYMLANPYKRTRTKLINTSALKFPTQPKTIITPVAREKLIHEINLLNNTENILLTSKNYTVYFADSKQIPNILREIGRLREVTFRSIGEGTNKAIDLDKYDSYYKHMFLWDNDAKCIVGAYRMGLGDEIYKNFGIDGFYINELFGLEVELYPMFSKTIEMGRAFVIKEYQQRPMPLFLLWKGIVHVTFRYPHLKYLMGGVSISNKFSNFTKSLMVEFMKSNYYDPYVAQYVHPKKEYKVRLKDEHKDFIFDASQADMNKFDKIIDEIEPGSLRLPVLLKKYVKQNAKLVAFNVDPKFNNSIDGLMYIRIADLPDSTVKPVLEEIQADLEKRLSFEP